MIGLKDCLLHKADNTSYNLKLGRKHCKRSTMQKYLARFIPNFLKPTLKRIYYFSLYVIVTLKGGDSMIPPKSIIFVGHGDFEEIGQQFKGYFIALADLQPNHRVLDVGCGIGRMAVPLTNYLSKEGEYWGFDINKMGIEWCKRRISRRFSNFHFQHIDIYNKIYNPSGKVRARDLHFPFDHEFFDFVFLTSVFTHMLPSDIENYLSEISRVLKTGRRCLITFFILNEESENLIRSGHSTLDFRYNINGYLTINENDPEAAVAYNEEFVIRLFKKYGLQITQPIHYGSWCKRDSFLTYQDLIIATKNNSN